VFESNSLEEALVHAKSLTIPELVIKRGAEHTLVRPEKTKEWLSIPTLSVQQVIDTTAAGASAFNRSLTQPLRAMPLRQPI